MKIINFENKQYPAFQSTGNAARFAIPFAKATAHSADLSAYRNDSKSKQSFLDLTLEDHYYGNEVLEMYSDQAQGYLQFDDGTVSKHFIRRERNFTED